MKAMSLTEVYRELSEWFREFSDKISINARNKLAHLIVELDTAITVNKQAWDQDNIDICLASLHRLEPNFQYDRCSVEHLLYLRDFLTIKQLCILLDVKEGTLDSRIRHAKRTKEKPNKLSDTELPTDIESIKKMSNEEFSDIALMQGRLSALKALSSSNIEITKWILTSNSDQKVKDVDKMWQLCKDFLAWWTGPCIHKMVRKITQARPPFDAKVLMAEVADEEYTELVRKYQEAKPRVEIPMEIPMGKLVEKAKRRGKEKWTRKREEKEAKLLKASSSTAPIPTENAESVLNSVEEGHVDVTPNSTPDTSGARE